MIREKVYYGKADAGTRHGNMTKPDLGKKPAVTDEVYETDRFTAYRSILEKVAANMGVTIDFDDGSAIETFVENFNALSYEDRLRYGLYEPGAGRDFQLSELIKAGKTLKEAERSLI